MGKKHDAYKRGYNRGFQAGLAVGLGKKRLPPLPENPISLRDAKKAQREFDGYSEPVSVKVSTINNWFHVRVFYSGKLFSEVRCNERLDVSRVIQQELRWVNKLGYESQMADRARHRESEKGYSRSGQYVGSVKTIKRGNW